MANQNQQVASAAELRAAGITLAPESQTGAEYRVLVTSHINGRVVYAGEVVKYDGVPGRYLEPLNAAAATAKKKADEIRRKPRSSTVRTEEVSTNAAAEELRAFDNERRGIDPLTAIVPGLDQSGRVPSQKERAALEEAERTTREAVLEQQQKAGGVLVQLTGTSPETVIPTTGPDSVAPGEVVAASEKKAEKAPASVKRAAKGPAAKKGGRAR